MKAEPNRIWSKKDGFEIEEEWIEEYQDWLTIRVDDRWCSNCKYIYIFDLTNQIGWTKWLLPYRLSINGLHEDERKRELNALRNKHHFWKSDEALQAMRDKFKKQRQHKKAIMEIENNEKEENSGRDEQNVSHGSECTMGISLLF